MSEEAAPQIEVGTLPEDVQVAVWSEAVEETLANSLSEIVPPALVGTSALLCGCCGLTHPRGTATCTACGEASWVVQTTPIVDKPTDVAYPPQVSIPVAPKPRTVGVEREQGRQQRVAEARRKLDLASKKD